MEIVIHGTKKGRKIFTPNEIGGLLDVTPDSPKIKAIGENAYAIRLINSSTIYSKYKIIKDVLGEKRIGFMGFSLFLSNTEKLSGEHIIALLDRVSEEYCTKYIIDNNWNQVTEDWDFVKFLSREYESKLSKVSIEDSENIQSGVLDEAFVYFYNDTELQKYFNQPYQEEYKPFRQIFFLSNNLKDKPENPLNALRNSGVDLTGKIDLENPSYKLREFHGNAKNGVSVSIKKSTGRPLYNKDKIFSKDELTVVYSKKNHKEKRIIGSLLNSAEIRFYLNTSNDSKIDVLKDVILEPEDKTITFEIVKKDGSKAMDAVISCKNNFQPEKQVLNNRVTFSGEDLNERWTVSAINGEYKGEIIIIPEEVNNEVKKIQLIRKKDVKLKVLSENGNIIYNYKVYCQSHRDSNKYLSEIEFIDDEIDKTWNIHIYGNNDYENSPTKQFCPDKNGNEIIFNLKDKTSSNNLNPQNYEPKTISDENDLKDQREVIPFFKKPKFIIVSILSVLLLSIGIWCFSHFVNKTKSNEKLISPEQITNYLESDYLILDTLKSYKINWEKQNPQSKKEEDESLFSIVVKKPDPAKEQYSWIEINHNLDEFITIRNLIDKKDFEKLKKVHFNNHGYFEQTIRDLNRSKYKLLKEKLGDVSSLSLPQIESKIKEILNEQESTGSSDLPSSEKPETTLKGKKPQQSTGVITAGSVEKKENEGRAITSANTTGTSKKSAITTTDGKTSNSSSDISSEIKKYIKSDEIAFSKLEDYSSKKVDSKIKESITIALNLWELDGTDAKAKREYLKKIEDNSNLRGSKLNLFVKNNITKDLKKWNRKKSLKEITNENN